MCEETPKVEFALGSEVSPGHFFKSSFARSFVGGCHGDSKSLESRETRENGKDFYSLVDFALGRESNRSNENVLPRSKETRSSPSTSFSQLPTFRRPSPEDELEQLRKKCQSLTEENRKLQSALTTSRVPHLQTIDNVFLQTQVDTLQWQLKQTEANREMYRSLMEQVARFLDRARKSLDILHEKNNSKEKSGRVPRSRSVNAVHAKELSTSSSSSSSSAGGSSRFARAKSVAQISQSTTGFREYTWSVLRRNDPVHCTPPRGKPPQDRRPEEMRGIEESVVYRRPKQTELDPDDVPPEKLSQEAFRLMRTVQSLLATREPDLARVAINGSTNRTSGNLEDICSSNDSSGNESDGKPSCRRRVIQDERDLRRRSLDAASLNSGSSKESRVVTSTPDDKRGAVKCLGSVDDESGFSSMSSFQEVGLPVLPPPQSASTPIKGCHTEIGLPEVPLEKVARHRRWSSTPAEIQALFKRHSGNFSSSRVTAESLSVWV